MNTLKKIKITAVAIFTFTIIYFILASKEVYTLEPQIIKIYYPIGVALGIFTIILLNSYIIKSGTRYLAISIFTTILFFLFFNFAVENFYRPILCNYYEQGHSTLLNIVEYGSQKGNYITIHRKMLRKGIFAYAIGEGYSDENRDLSRKYNKQMTYHVNNKFIIFDWNTEKVIKIEEVSISAKRAWDYLKQEVNISQNQFEQYYANGCHINIYSGDKIYDIRAYAKNGNIAYKIDE